MCDRPSSLEDYLAWATSELKHDFSGKHKTWYDLASANLRTKWEATPFVVGVAGVLEQADKDYRDVHGVALFAAGGVPPVTWHVKPYDSVLNKIFRANVVWNGKFPKEPKDGWCGPDDVLARFDDVLRSRLVLRYLDGPEYLASRIGDFAKTLGLGCEYSSRELDDGYYAFHVYVNARLELPNRDLNIETITSRLELQLTTQLQDVLRDLTHRFYEQRRLDPKPDRKSWKWKHTSDHFRSAYLGHALHLLEGIILEVRDGESAGKGNSE